MLLIENFLFSFISVYIFICYYSYSFADSLPKALLR